MSHSIFDIRRHPLAFCMCALLGFAAVSPVGFAAEKPESQKISRTIAKEITAAKTHHPLSAMRIAAAAMPGRGARLLSASVAIA